MMSSSKNAVNKDTTYDTPDFWKRRELLWRLPRVSSTELLVLLLLNDFLGNKLEAYPAQPTLAARIRVTDRQVRKLIGNLESAGWITVRRSTPNRYRINWPAIVSAVEQLKPEPQFRIGESQTGTPVPDSNLSNRNSATPNRNPSSGESGTPVPTNIQEHSTEHQKWREESDSKSEPIPSELDTPEARQALEDWRQHRKELRKKWTPSAERALFRKWSKIGPARFIAAVEHSIGNGWQGVFEPKTNCELREGQPADADDVMAKHTAEVLSRKRAEAAANGGPTS